MFLTCLEANTNYFLFQSPTTRSLPTSVLPPTQPLLDNHPTLGAIISTWPGPPDAANSEAVEEGEEGEEERGGGGDNYKAPGERYYTSQCSSRDESLASSAAFYHPRRQIPPSADAT